MNLIKDILLDSNRLNKDGIRIHTDTELVENKHSGKYISNLNFDVNLITGMLSNSFLNFFKDGLTLIGLLRLYL